MTNLKEHHREKLFSTDRFNIYRIKETYRQANSLIIISKFSETAIIVDMGFGVAQRCLDLIRDCEAEPKGILITHGHLDHFKGLLDISPEVPFFCSDECFNFMKDSKLNLSKYMDGIKPIEFKDSTSQHFVRESSVLLFGDLKFVCYETFGHTTTCLSYGLERVLFTGDALMLDYHTPLNFPHSDKLKYEKTIDKYLEVTDDYDYFFGGHGDFGLFNKEILETKKQMLLNSGRT